MVEFWLLAFVIAIAAGTFGALVGVGGGLVLVPLLTIALGVDIRLAIAASLLGVVAVSCSATPTFLARGLADRRVALPLLVATAAGGILGGFVAGLLDGRVLAGVFGVVLLAVAAQMVRRPIAAPLEPAAPPPSRLELDSDYLEPSTGEYVSFRARRIGLGALVSVGAGGLSGLLGIGGGVVNVPTMNLLMGVPLRVATTTSTYMLGATAAASAIIYYSRGEIDPLLAAPIVVGVLLGARAGALLGARAPQRLLQVIFAVAALAFAGQMLLRAWQGG